MPPSLKPPKAFSQRFNVLFPLLHFEGRDRGIHTDNYILLYNYEENSPLSQDELDSQHCYASESSLEACLDVLNDIDKHDVNIGRYHPYKQQISTAGNVQHTAGSHLEHENF